MVTGSFPPRACGVGDYTAHLSRELRREGVPVTVVTNRSWGVLSLPSLIRLPEVKEADVVHIQYPSVGYGASVAPQAVAACKRPTVVTLHEFSQAHPLRKIAMLPFLRFASHVIFTSSFEKATVEQAFPSAFLRRAETSVINIGSNIASSAPHERAHDEAPRIVYFGLIRPNKGIEDFLRVSQLSRETGRSWEFLLVGQPSERHQHYVEAVLAAARDHGVTVVTDAPEPAVARLLEATTAAYLPFPDGASERRGSLIATLQAGVPVVTTEGPQTPDEMDDVLLYAQTPSQALARLDFLVADSTFRSRVAMRSTSYAERFHWRHIVDQHKVVYREVMMRSRERVRHRVA